MRHVVRKYFMNPEKEESWINEMAEKGWGLVACSWLRYEFEDIIPGEYTYKIYAMKEKPGSKEWKMQLKSLAEMNITCVANDRQWAYLRKIAINGPIEIRSAKAMRVAYLKKLHHIWGTLAILGLAIGASQLFIIVAGILNGVLSSSQSTNVLVMLAVFILAAIFLTIEYYINGQIKELEEDEKRE